MAFSGAGGAGSTGSTDGVIRVVAANSPPTAAAAHTTRRAGANAVRNTKYRVWNFPVLFLAGQLRQFMNSYFIVIAALQLWSAITPVDPLTTWMPLAVIFGVAAFKEAVDDIRRALADRAANARPYVIVRDGRRERRRAADIAVGDIVEVPAGAEVPCDLALLCAAGGAPECLLQTANLDGESDLKVRTAPAATAALGAHAPESLCAFRGAVECAATPSQDIFAFDARLVVPAADSPSAPAAAAAAAVSAAAAAPTPLDAEQLLQRATFVRSPAWVAGLAVYTGAETKIALNKGDVPTKWTRLDRRVNAVTAAIFALQLTLVVIFGTTGNVWQAVAARRGAWYLGLGRGADGALVGVLGVVAIPLRFLLLLSMMIPISLKVTLDILKFCNAQFVNWDAAMPGARANNTSIGEDLGQVTHVFCDKTGTLTENEMVFAGCAVPGAAAVPGEEAVTAGPSADGAASPGDSAAATSTAAAVAAAAAAATAPFRLFSGGSRDPELAAAVAAHDAAVLAFLRALALCNDVSVTVEPGDGGDDGCGGAAAAFSYTASSPDEVALVGAARDAGVALAAREGVRRVVRIAGAAAPDASDSAGVAGDADADVGFEMLAVLAFTPERRRMSVVVREEAPPRRVWVITKGADDAVLPLLAPGTRRRGAGEHGAQTPLRTFASAGLRTLCVAAREMPAAEAVEWVSAFRRAASAVEARAARLAEASASAESGLVLLGVSAVEDRLQDGVPETLAALRAANIKLWMLTGDKRETALQIARRVRMIGARDGGCGGGLAGAQDAGGSDDDDDDDDDEEEKDRAGAFVGGHAACPPTRTVDVDLAGGGDARGALARAEADATAAADAGAPVVVVAEGRTLDAVLAPEHRARFRRLVMRADVEAVVCCRVAPRQKAEVVRLVRRGGGRGSGGATLAVGDGGNDVMMILAADVGVGIFGHEGLQAARASDYALPRFRHLARLLLVHGRYACMRSSFVAQYSFYKSLFIGLVQLLFQFSCGFSGASFFNTFSLATYNVVFTGLPPVFFALDRDVPAVLLLRDPARYRDSQSGRMLCARSVALWFARAVFQGGIVYALTYAVYRDFVFPRTGAPMDYETVSMTTETALVLVNTATVVSESHTLTILNHAAIWGTLAAYFALVAVASAFHRSATAAIAARLFVDPTFWAAVALAVFAAVAPVWLIKRVFGVARKPPCGGLARRPRRRRYARRRRGSMEGVGGADTDAARVQSMLPEDGTDSFPHVAAEDRTPLLRVRSPRGSATLF